MNQKIQTLITTWNERPPRVEPDNESDLVYLFGKLLPALVEAMPEISSLPSLQEPQPEAEPTSALPPPEACNPDFSVPIPPEAPAPPAEATQEPAIESVVPPKKAGRRKRNAQPNE